MAKCAPLTKLQTVVVPDGVLLELTAREALALAVILGHIGGDAALTARREADNIADALKANGYGYCEACDTIGYDPTGEHSDLQRTIMMRKPIPVGL